MHHLDSPLYRTWRVNTVADAALAAFMLSLDSFLNLISLNLTSLNQTSLELISLWEDSRKDRAIRSTILPWEVLQWVQEWMAPVLESLSCTVTCVSISNKKGEINRRIEMDNSVNNDYYNPWQVFKGIKWLTTFRRFQSRIQSIFEILGKFSKESSGLSIFIVIILEENWKKSQYFQSFLLTFWYFSLFQNLWSVDFSVVGIPLPNIRRADKEIGDKITNHSQSLKTAALAKNTPHLSSITLFQERRLPA